MVSFLLLIGLVRRSPAWWRRLFFVVRLTPHMINTIKPEVAPP